MDDQNQKFSERRTAVRINCQKPLMFKVCKEETISKILEGYTHNISSDGLKCTIPQKVPMGSTLWLMLDKDLLTACEEIEQKAVVLQHGVLGKVVWVDEINPESFDIGLQFITREAKTD